LDTASRIEAILRERFAPEHFELRDRSESHAGHAGATSGGGHYRVVLVSREFEGLSRLDRHRAVNEALADLYGTQIHALALKTVAPSEWRAAADAPAAPPLGE
jgi:BolA protein